MTSTSGRRTARRLATGVGVVAAGGLLVPSGVAYADPEEQSQEDVEAELDELNQEASGIVDKYNEAKEDYDAAKEEADELEEEVGDEQDNYDELRDEVAQFASATYKGNDLDSSSNVLTVEDPEELLENASDVDYLSETQQSKLDEFAGSSERLFDLKEEADDALEDAEDKKDELGEKKDKVEEKIEKQEELLAEFPDADPATSGDDSGGSYSGSASGDARAALDFAYAQIGKPYVYGAAGPDSYDCSGLTMRAYGSAGVSLPRTTYAQAEVGQRINSMSALQPGDLVFFFGDLGHMGIYAGGNQMVHAPRSGKNVEVVSLSGYWAGQFQFGTRP
ncbi:cell wall-associated NlpC family hydrolase [Lipingzhangella halophila]|uniref:Cell wall-associated NlpC family hydrolase n=1 Tax=Lipingzhangella halophila TaxID=1783352 RepID=A0A7W7RF32_9ACTN|nr:C40 family peptidase [Lipingzhangella halophila]MBB4930829.1 cell wall-associated NlpC family hydrolase [Lipingzhangella halophila]